MKPPDKKDSNIRIGLLAVFAVICCALAPLLLISGLSLAALGRYWPAAAVLVLGGAALVWHLKRRRADRGE